MPVEMMKQNFASLQDNEKRFVTEHLTNEIAMLFGMLFGQEVGQYTASLSNPETVLIPVPRAELDNAIQDISSTPSETPEEIKTDEATLSSDTSSNPNTQATLS